MINKVIHYCWFGKNEKSLLIEECIDSWKKYCPDYEIIEWNEDNFDIESNIFTKEAYENKKWAFVSDYVRLYVLKEYGGIYLDTDVEITQNLDKFLGYKFFSGKESSEFIITGLIGSIKDGEIVKKLIKYYDNKKFVLNDGSLDMTTNTKIITDALIKDYSINKLDDEIKISNNEVIFNENYFCNKNDDKDNYAVHHYNGSWRSKNDIKNEMIMYKNQYNILNELIDMNYKKNKLGNLKSKILDRRICIYGFGSIGKLVEQILQNNKINNYIIYDSSSNYKEELFVSDIEFVKNNCDLIIVTPWKYYDEINIEFERIKCINIFDLIEIEIKRF